MTTVAEKRISAKTVAIVAWVGLFVDSIHWALVSGAVDLYGYALTGNQSRLARFATGGRRSPDQTVSCTLSQTMGAAALQHKSWFRHMLWLALYGCATAALVYLHESDDDTALASKWMLLALTVDLWFVAHITYDRSAVSHMAAASIFALLVLGAGVADYMRSGTASLLATNAAAFVLLFLLQFATTFEDGALARLGIDGVARVKNTFCLFEFVCAGLVPVYVARL